MNKRALIGIVLVTGLALVMAGMAVAQARASSAVELELVAEVIPTSGIALEHIDAIQVLDSNPNEIVFVTQNQGATCGGGTPASAWKMTLDPNTGEAVSVVLKQSLSKIQNARGALFESSDATLFAGGGWCDYKPPYYSTDGGETWQSADAGPVHPPNSTFSFGEFKGDVYAGTGYAPYYGQVYRWLGDGYWQLVLDIPLPRSIVRTMVAYEDRLFIGSTIYGGSACAGSVPVYVSADGNTFNPTTGIPSCYSVSDLLVVGDQLVARVSNYFNITELYMYRWNNDLEEWEAIGAYNLGSSRPNLVSHEGVIYAYGHAPGDASAGIYQSVNVGQTWQQIVILEGPAASTMTMHNGTLYLGTQHTASNSAYIYRAKLITEVEIDIKPGSDPNSINLCSHGVVPVAILSEDGFDATTVDPQSVEFAGATIGLRGKGVLQYSLEDVDGDGDTDFVAHIPVENLDLEADSTQASVNGSADGVLFEGTDWVNIVRDCE
jgi:hypothetical protein